jgi:hypothetical protein
VGRFERISQPVMGCKLCGRRQVNPRLDFKTAMDPGAFLARLWALFGAASREDDGFIYELSDRQSGLEFSAYSGPSGPSYGGDHQQLAELRPVLEDFERLLEATEPVDCEHVFRAGLEDGGGEIAIGWREGRSFERSVRRPHP